jgi:hypothetical protein
LQVIDLQGLFSIYCYPAYTHRCYPEGPTV